MSELAIQDERLGRKVGALVLAVIVVASAAVITLFDRVQWHRTITFEVAFDHVGALREGAPLMQAGQPVGVVQSIVLAPQDDAGTRGVRARVKLERRFAHRVALNAEFFVGTRGLFGDRYLEIGAPADGAAPSDRLTEGAVVRGIDPPLIDRVLMRTWQNLSISRRFLDEVKPEFTRLTEALGELGATLETLEPTTGAFADTAIAVRALASEATAFRATLAASGVSAEALTALRARTNALGAAANRAAGELERSAATLRHQLEVLRGRVPPELSARVLAIAAQLEALRARLPGLRARAQELATRIAQGQGTVGSLLHDPEFSDDAKELGKILKRNPWRVFGHDQE